MSEAILVNPRSWLASSSAGSEIIFSSRIRLARNFEKFPFPWRASSFQRDSILKKIAKAHKLIDGLDDSVFISLYELNSIDKQFLLERHLISKEHLTNLRGKAVIITADERISIMINEEDHLRIQVINSGLNLTDCWQICNNLDDQLSGIFPFAFLPDIGYLTSCPTNVGTGLRASCMVHLPALVLTKRINKVLDMVIKNSFNTRGLFGEGTQALGDFFQISNHVSLGLSEEEIISNLIGMIEHVREVELDARYSLLEKKRLILEDNIWRSLGILQNCRLISYKEALSHLSLVALGVDLKIVEGLSKRIIDNLFIGLQPAHLQKLEEKLLDENQRDYIRACILRDSLKI